LRVDRLSVRDFRNLATVDLDLAGDLIVFHGDNGQGKTNLLEAIYLLANLKSFRNARRKDMVRWDASTAAVVADVVSGDVRRHFEVRLDRQQRRARIDGKDPRSLLTYFRGIRAIAFTPEDPAMVRGGPLRRRAFMDRGIFLSRPDHLDLVRQYARLVDQKTALLRGMGTRSDPEQVSVWNERMAELGAEIVLRRTRFLEELESHLDTVHRLLNTDGSTISTSYRSCCEAGDAEDLLQRLEGRLQQEQERGQCLVGPQREDLVLRLDDRDLRTFGSQGQVRSAALVLKLSLMSLVSRGSDDPPMFLLDDLGSELDPARNRRLLELLRDLGGQVLVATTSMRHVPLEPSEFLAVRVEEGRVTPLLHDPGDELGEKSQDAEYEE